MKNTNPLYDRFKNKGKIAERTLNILNSSGKKNKLGRPYSLRYIYLLATRYGTDKQVDLAIMQACEDYMNELQSDSIQVKEEEARLLKKAESLVL